MKERGEEREESEETRNKGKEKSFEEKVRVIMERGEERKGNGKE